MFVVGLGIFKFATKGKPGEKMKLCTHHFLCTHRSQKMKMVSLHSAFLRVLLCGSGSTESAAVRGGNHKLKHQGGTMSTTLEVLSRRSSVWLK